MPIEPGIYPNLSNKDYHADPALSNSMMQKPTALHMKSEMDNPSEATPAMILGAAFHCKVLQPHLFDAEFIIWPTGYRRKTYETEEAKAKGQAWIKDVDLIDINNMIEALNNHEVASALLSDGEPEVSYFWQHKLGFMCKARPDYRKGDSLIDLKTTVDASPEGFAKAIANFKYHRQGDHYMCGVAANKVETENFVIIAQEKKPPYAIGLYRLSEDDLYLGHEENKLIYQQYEECLSTNKWEGYSANIENISLPQWYIRTAKI